MDNELVSLKRYNRFDATLLTSDIFEVNDEEYNKYKNGISPIKSVRGDVYYFDEKRFIHRENNLPAIIFFDGMTRHFVHGKLHRTDGREDGSIFYFLNGIQYDEIDFKKAVCKRIYFLREKIICLKNLLEIPEMWDEVYYTHKGKFLTLLDKI